MGLGLNPPCAGCGLRHSPEPYAAVSQLQLEDRVGTGGSALGPTYQAFLITPQGGLLLRFAPIYCSFCNCVPTCSTLLQELEESSRIMGYAAVKYADLKNQRLTNYKFSFDDMLSLKGNTAVYLLYAHARIAGIVRKSNKDVASARPPPGS